MNKKKKLTKEQAIAQLWEVGDLSYKLKGVQKDMRDLVYDSEHDITLFLCSRQTGKCLVEGTKIATPYGSKNIEDIKVGDIVYGFDSSGKITPTEVKQFHNQGAKEVIELKHRGRVVAECTLDHRWLVWDSYRKKERVVETRELLSNKRLKISRRYFITEDLDGVTEQHAYALGSLLGDGYGKFNNNTNNQISISSIDRKIPEKIANSIGSNFWKQRGNNFSWILANYEHGEGMQKKKQVPITVNHYDDWCKGKMAHEKTCDYDVIKTWDRRSQLEFIAGVVDTDGSIYTVNNGKELKFTLSMQSFDVIDCVKKLFLDLWQIELDYYLDDRDKYVNGPCHVIYKNNNFCVKLFLKELSQHIVTDSKKYSDEYDNLIEHNHKEMFCGVVKGGTSIKQTYDIGIDNETHLYALANGLITHNSFTMCLIASEYCQRNPNTRVVLMFPKKNMANSVAKEQMRIIHDDCPEHLKPEHKVADKEFIYPNGSVIMLAGADAGHAESVRGKTVHLTLCDEAGFFPYNDMLYIVNSILMPTMTTTNGKMIIASTPSKEPDHPFLTDFVEPYRANGWLMEYDIYSNPLIDDKMRAKIINRYPLGEEDPEYQREYLLMTKVSNSLMVVPEWYDLETDIVKASERPLFTDNYVSMDPAVVDGTGVIFGYYDFKREKLVIEDELFLGGDGSKSLTTQEIADGVIRKEGNLFRNRYTGEINEPYMRISDNNLPLLINDLQVKHGIRFRTTKKDGKEDKVNRVRMLMKRGHIEIHPRCKLLISHIRTAKWKSNRKEFVRNKGDQSKGINPNHSDLLDALVYLVRNYQPSKNPYPDGYFDLTGDNVFQSQRKDNPSENKELMSSIMNIKKK